MKKLISILSVIAMLMAVVAMIPMTVSAAPFAFGEVATDYTPDATATPISSVEDFLAMTSGNNYYLTQDIDFSGKTYEGCVLPVRDFDGTIDGCGYALKGITVTSTGDAGIFDLWFKGTLKNIELGTEDAPVSITSDNGGASVGVVSGTSGSATFDNVKIYANVDARGKTAGFTAYMNSDTVTINNCAVYGSIKGGATAGFLVTSSGNDHTTTFTITNSANYADISSYTIAPVGGIYTRDVDAGENRTTYVTIKGCVNYGNITANDWRVGGIVGEYSGKAGSMLLVDHCYNLGTVTMINTGGFAGGIVGGMANNNDPTETRTVTNCYNAGTVQTQGDFADRANGLCYSEKRNDNVTVKNSITLGTPYDTSDLKEENVVIASDASELLPFLTACEAADATLTFVADTDNVNNGYPLLSWQVVPETVTPDPDPTPDPEPELPTVPAFSAGTITEGEDGYTIASDDFSAFVSSRAAAKGGASDLRFILAANFEKLTSYDSLTLTVAFADANGSVIKTLTEDVFSDLLVYAKATGAGKTYIAAEGSVLFGIVIKGAPNGAWNTVTVTLTGDDAVIGAGEVTSADVSTVEGVDLLTAGGLANLVIEDHHGSTNYHPTLVFFTGATAIYHDLRGESYEDWDNWSNAKYQWIATVNGKDVTVSKFSLYDGGDWGYLRADLGDQSLYNYVNNKCQFAINLKIVDVETGKIAYYANFADNGIVFEHKKVGLYEDESKPAGLVRVENVTPVSGPNAGGGEGFEKIVDNDIKTKLCTGDWGADHPIVLKFDAEKTLKGIGIVNANDNKGSTGRTVIAFEVWVSEDGENWGEAAAYATNGDGINKADVSENYQERYVDFGTTVSATYVKLVINNGEMYQMSEVFFYE